ncbi:SpoIIE family protein phosphatase [Streptomyces fructofermentans]|uniref:SpoIIE family protein phosphatase n=1 Tax=Streptomyces fructofermentans TaxID=152141 RepID=UPI00340973AA
MSLRKQGKPALAGLNSSLLDGLLSHSPIGMAVMDTDLRYVWINEALVGTSGAPDRIGKKVSAVFPAEEAEAGEAMMLRVLETGVPRIDFEYRGPILSDPAGEHMYSASFFRLEDQMGAVTGLCYLVIDVTERWKARQRGQILSRARECGKQLDPTLAAQDLADLCVPDFADLVTIELFEAVVQGTEVLAPSPGDSLLMLHAGHRVADTVESGPLPGAGSRAVYGPDSLVARCLVSRSGILDVSLSRSVHAWDVEASPITQLIENGEADSVIAVPLCEGGVTFGIAVFMRTRGGAPFTDADLEFAEEFAVRGSSALASAHRFTQERRVSLALQRNLLPGLLVGDESLDVAWRYFPAAEKEGVGGDWVDVIHLSSGRVALVVGDVVGHGVNAAATMGRLRAAVHTLAAMDLPPDELLAHLDDFVVRLGEERSAGGDSLEEDGLLGTLGASCMYAVYDPVSRTCAMARAGHPPPAMRMPDGTALIPDVPAGSPLGIGTVPFESAEIDCPDGSLLALFTDGLVESRSQNIDQGISRLLSVLREPYKTLDELCDATVEEMISRPLRDDAALLVARIASFPSSDVVTWDVPADFAAVGEFRRLASRQLEEWNLESLQFSTELIVSELVTNAIRYGTSPITLRMIRHSVLTCEVVDSSSTSPRLRHAKTMDEGGRGLFLVAQASKGWGYRYTGSGKAIWVEQDLP